MRFFSLISGFCAALLLSSGCAWKTYTIPPDGVRVPYQDLIADEHGNFLLKLEDFGAVDYQGFSIRTPRKPLFQAGLAENARNRAVWRAAHKLRPGQNFVCTANLEMLPPQLVSILMKTDSPAGFCKAKYAGADNPRLQHFSSQMIEFQGHPAVSYEFRMRDFSTGANTLVNGVMLFLPDEPGVILEAQYAETGYGITAEKRDKKLKELGETFFSLIRLP